jgi:uncharacterized protein DUF4124
MRRLLVVAFALSASSAAAQTMYKCVDARGVTRYTDRPQPGCKGAEVKIEGQPPISGKLSPPTEDFKRDEQGFQRRRIAEERGREAEQKAREEQNRRCATLQADLRRLESGLRLVRPDAKGGYDYVEDQERDQRAERLREELAQKCR